MLSLISKDAIRVLEILLAVIILFSYLFGRDDPDKEKNDEKEKEKERKSTRIRYELLDYETARNVSGNNICISIDEKHTACFPIIYRECDFSNLLKVYKNALVEQGYTPNSVTIPEEVFNRMSKIHIVRDKIGTIFIHDLKIQVLKRGGDE